MFFVGKNIVVDTSMSDLAARATTGHNNPAPKEGGSAIAMESTGIVIRCIAPTVCGKMGGGGSIEYRILADPAPWLN